MTSFIDVYNALNDTQRKAVDHIDGPLLIIAGPGTGKTQLLSARVANILEKTDTPARNILCLTFTESGAENMRERLTRFIGNDAYDVGISTYHAFGRELISRFPEYFTETRLQNSVDELGQRQIVDDIVEHMSYTNPLKQTRHHEGDLLSTISEVKRALLTAEDLRLIAAENLLFIKQADRGLEHLFDSFGRMPKLSEALALFEKILLVLADNAPTVPVNMRFGSLAQTGILSLRVALDEAAASGKTTALTSWKNDWLARDGNNKLTFGGELESKRVEALADVMDQYQAALGAKGLYDYDDMILRAIDALERHDDLRFTLQERYLYLLLDEFQDTNAAQLKLVQLLTNNPVHEGKPNVMAVGDDDQAIYAFQGALYSNMLDFYHMYRDVHVINLTENYRSHAAIIATAGNVAGQIAERLHVHFAGASKVLAAANHDLPKRADIERCEFLSDIAHSDWVAHRVKALVDAGTKPSEIAILAPKHKQLEPLVPYLNACKIPVRYEKRENILDAHVVKQLLTMSRLVLALRAGDEATADSLWPEVLSYDFWGLSTSSIWEVSWRIMDARHQAAADGQATSTSWSRELLADGKRFRVPALLFLTLANKAGEESGEIMLDYLIGSSVVDTNEADLPQLYSPLRGYYTSTSTRREQPELFYETMSHLTTLRARLREHQNASEAALSLQDLINFVDLYEAADERMINTSPYNQAADSVQLMTVFKAKGLEFEHVFLLNLQDDVWGSSSRGQSNRISLPANLVPIRHAGVTDDERLRILYVALTRAKFGVHLTSVTQSYNGRTSKRLRYLEEQEQPDGTVRDLVLPQEYQEVGHNETAPPSLEQLERDWHRRHIAALQQPDLRALLAPRIANYRLSPTHLGEFLDLEYGGPEPFFFTTILRFPEAPTIDSQFGSAIHETLEWVQHMVTERGAVPDTREALLYFVARMRAKKLTEARTTLEVERGELALSAYLSSRKDQYKPTDKAEVPFRHERVAIGPAQLSGKIDKLEIDRKSKTITVVDYKTGKSYSKWLSDPKLYKYRRQLYSYKLLVENSAAYAGYTVNSGRLEFVEPAYDGRVSTLELRFDKAELKRTRQLMEAMWQHVQKLEFPDVGAYNASLSGIKRFEDDLIHGNI